MHEILYKIEGYRYEEIWLENYYEKWREQKSAEEYYAGRHDHLYPTKVYNNIDFDLNVLEFAEAVLEDEIEVDIPVLEHYYFRFDQYWLFSVL